jgi:putative CocE/NonD family hydrolase
VFHSGSLLEEVPSNSAPDHYVYDPREVSHGALESTIDPDDVADQRLVHARVGQQLIYHSAPFDRDTEISGFFKFSAWLAIDQSDTDYCVSVYAIEIDGSSILLSVDWIRARYRESLREERLIQTREPLRYDFERFMFISRRLKRGTRLRLVIGSLNSIYFQKNYNSGGVISEESMQDARPVKVMLFHDAQHPSALYVPLGHS